MCEDAPDRKSALYSKPVEVSANVTLRVRAIDSHGQMSRINEAIFEKSDIPEPVYGKMYNSRYSAGGSYALIDGKIGSTRFADGAWQGFEADNFEVVIDLGKTKKISSIEVGFLQDTNAWIFFPKDIIFEISTDGENYQQVYKKDVELADHELPPKIKRFKAELDVKEIRFVRVLAKNIKTCPDWHKGAGGKSWIFVDELIIN